MEIHYGERSRILNNPSTPLELLEKVAQPTDLPPLPIQHAKEAFERGRQMSLTQISNL